MKRYLMILSLIVFVCVLPAASPVLAQVLYNPRDILRVPTIDPQVLRLAPRQATESGGEVPAELLELTGQNGEIGTVTKQRDLYVFRTGASGAAQGEIPRGLYVVSVAKENGLVFSVPKREVLVSGLDNEMIIGASTVKGKGIVRYGESSFLWRFSSWFKQVTDAIGGIFGTKSKEELTISSVPLLVWLHEDANGNRVRDPGEAAFDRDGILVALRKISTESIHTFNPGVNHLKLARLPLNINSSFKILDELRSVGVTDAVVTGEEPRRQTVVFRDGAIYGEDFLLERNGTYRVTVKDPVTISLVYPQ